MYPLLLMLAVSASPDADYLKAFAPEDVSPPTVVVPVQPKKTAPTPVKPAKVSYRPLRIEIFEPVSAAPEVADVPDQLEATVYTNEDGVFPGWCENCNKKKRLWGKGNAQIKIIWSPKAPPTGPRNTYPQIRWKDSSGAIRRPGGSNPDTLEQLIKLIERSNAPASPSSGVKFGNVWVESATGTTSIEHLIQEHGLTWEQVAPFAHDQNALNRIHGWKHESRGSLPPGTVASRRRDPPPAAAGVVGAIQGSDQIRAAQAWWLEQIGEGFPVSLECDRSGAQFTPILGGKPVSLINLIGRMGAVRFSAPGSKLKIKEAELTYRKLPNGKWRISGSTDIDVSEDGTVSSSNDQVVGFIDPVTIGTIWTLISGARTIWDAFHPTADITLPGSMAATATLNGDVLTVDFQQGPQVRAKWLFLKFELGVRRAEISPSKVKVFFNGSNWIKSREFKVTASKRQTALAA